MARRLGHVASCLALLLTVFLSPGFLSSGAFALEERIGERLFLVRDKPGTSTQFHMIVNAGCTDEADGQCRGLAHYLEHLLLVGRNPEHKDAAVRIIPDGSANGWTTPRATAYLHTIPPRENGAKAELEMLFNFYAARLNDFSISDAEALRERSVVRQEYDLRVGNRPFVRLARALDRELLPDHPSGQLTSGTQEDIEALTLDAAREFHRKWYAVNNVYFVVKGDIEPGELKEIAERALAGLAPRDLPQRAVAVRPLDVTPQRRDFRAEDPTVKRPGLFLKRLIAIEEPDVVAGRAARLVLINFLRSRLPGSPYDVIVDREKLAAGPLSIAIERVAPQLFKLTIGAIVAPEVAPEQLLAGIERYVSELASAGIADEIIARLKTRIAESAAHADQEPAQVYSRLIGWLASREPYGDLALLPGHVAAVTPDDIATVLRGVSGPGRTVTGIFAAPKAEAHP